MQITSEMEKRIDEHIDSFVGYIKKQSEFRRYKHHTKYGPGSGFIELSTGVLLPEFEESVLVIPNEFRAFVLDILHKYVKLMHANVDNQLFGFAERPLFEYITTWVFLYLSPAVNSKDRDRLKTLLFAGHYKFITENEAEYTEYMRTQAKYLKQKDLELLESDGADSKSFFNYVWIIRREISSKYHRSLSRSVLDRNSFYESIQSHQHMRTHSNPLSLNELVGDAERQTRHRLLLLYAIGQVLDYLSSEEDLGLSSLAKKQEFIVSNLSKHIKP